MRPAKQRVPRPRVHREAAVAATRMNKPKRLGKDNSPTPKLSKLSAVCRALFRHDTRTVPHRPQPSAPVQNNRSAALQALLLSALALPGMSAYASPDDVINGTTTQAQNQTGQQSIDNLPADESQEIGIQYSHYHEGARDLIGPVTTGTIPATTGSTVTGTITGIGHMATMRPIIEEGEHAYARFRIGDRQRLGFDFIQDIWSGASPLATLPSNMISGASPSATILGYFNAQGKPVYISKFQANANPNSPAAIPQQLVLSPDTQVGHAMGYASPETRKQTSIKYGYDWDESSLDVSVAESREPDFISQFGNVAYRQDFNDKRTSINGGLSFTKGDIHAEQTTDGYQRMKTDAYPAGFPQSNTAGLMNRVYLGVTNPILAPIYGGSRQDFAMTLGLTQVINKNDLASTGIGLTRSSGFLSNPYKGAYVFLPSTGDPNVLALNPGVTSWSGVLELEHRPSLRNQFTWDTSYLHYFDGSNAAAQVHYGFFTDSWGIVASTFDAEWRQSLNGNWMLTPHIRYYTQKAADFYAPYFFANSLSTLSNYYFSSDERLSAFGSISPGITLSEPLSRGLKLEVGLDYYQRSGSLKLGPGGDGAYADLKATTFNITLRGSLDRAASDDSASKHRMQMGDSTNATSAVTAFMAHGSKANELMSMTRATADTGTPSTDANSQQPAGMPAISMDMSGHSMMHMADSSAAAPSTDDMHTMQMGHLDRVNAPAGVMGASMMRDPGMWMIGYSYEQDKQGDQLIKGKQAIPNNTANSGMWITDMTMNMHMFEFMYAQNTWLNWMVMPSLVDTTMGMYMNEIITGGSMAYMNMSMHTDMESGGVGDTNVSALIRLWDSDNQHLHLTQGLGVPTGSVNLRSNGTGTIYPYDMQLGSGTWDYKPSLTYTGMADAFSWGAQIGTTMRMQSRNSSGYSLGNETMVTAWGGYKLTSLIDVTLRAQYKDQGSVNGYFNSMLQFTGALQPGAVYSTSNYNTANYGGHFGDVGLGISAALGHGVYTNDRISVEWMKPVYTNFNGTQNNRLNTIFLSGKFMF